MKKTLTIIAIFALIGTGAILLALDYETEASKWEALIASVTCFAAALAASVIASKRNMLPE